MKCLTFGESEKWLASIGVRIDENRNLWFPNTNKKIMTTVPENASALFHFCGRLIDWLPRNCGRMFWLSNWNTEPSDSLIFFENVRKGWGEFRHVIDAPGHLLNHKSEQENAFSTGLVFLVVAFGWEGYLLAENHDAFVYFGDKHIVYSSVQDQKMTDIENLVSASGLQIITDIREAW